MMRITLCRLGRQVPTLCALVWLAASAGPASAQVASPFGFFRGRGVFLVDNPASNYGYNLDAPHPGYYGGGDYREYYAFGRGTGVANFPGPLPGPDYYWDWTSPWRHEWVLRPPRPAPQEIAADDPAPLTVSAVPRDEPIARFTVEVPADAEVYLEGIKTRQTGTNRVFVSPRLTPGKQYVYEVRARWMANGNPVEQTKSLMLTAGQRLTVHFPEASAAGGLSEPRLFPVGATRD